MTRRDADRMNFGPAGREAAPGSGRAALPSAAAFHDHALAHGPDIGTWPGDLRPAALAFRKAEPAAAAAALAEAAALDAALEAWAAEAPPLPDALFARMAADAEAALPAGAAAAVLSAAPGRLPVADARRGRPAARMTARPGARSRVFGALARLGAPAAFAASALLGVTLGYVGDDPLSQGFAALAMDQYEAAYEISLLDVELLSDDAFPDAESVR
ncbi:hypothetical protein [Albimonas pacifica]|uniref:Uncharacterized protein n=1 Tax=Albimonas pacifica TaxID=1114924 RepID=A0A1I3HME6_9RHOB|nr:hypothetical protein [Albimonas pacifica]SFI36779.1 hypothetical protein SAMN05216258_10670 [Albimonas pacifica]